MTANNEPKAYKTSTRTKTAIAFFILIFFYYLPLATAIIAPQTVLKISHALSVFSIFIFFLIIHPTSKQRFDNTPMAFSTVRFLKSLGLIWFIQIATLICFFSTFISIIHITPSAALPNLMQSSLLHGLFPWSLYSLIAVLFGYYVHQKQLPGHYISGIPYFKNTHTDATLKRIIGIVTSISSIIGALVLLVTGAVFLGDFFARLMHLPSLHEITINSIILGIAFLFITFSDDTQKVLDTIRKQGGTYGIIFLCIMALITIMVFLMNIFTHGFGTIEALSTVIPNIPFNTPDPTLIHLAYFGWFIVMAPIIVSAYVKCIKHYSIRMSFCITLSLPIIMVSIFTYFPKMAQLFSTPILTPFWELVAVIGLFILIGIFLFEKNSTRFITGFLPCPKDQTLLIPVKLKRSIKILTTLSGLIVLSYLFLGSSPMLVILFGLGPVLFIIQLFVIVAFCIRRIRNT